MVLNITYPVAMVSPNKRITRVLLKTVLNKKLKCLGTFETRTQSTNIMRISIDARHPFFAPNINAFVKKNYQ